MRRRGAIEEELLLARVARERGRALEIRARLVEAAELHEEVAAHRRQEMVVLEGRLGGERIDESQPFRRAESHGDGDRAIQLDDGGRRDLRERVVERRDARPVGVLRSARARVAGGDRGLQRVGSEPPAELLDKLLAQHLVDVGRAQDPDNPNLFTWWAPWRNLRQRNIGWRLDYVLASPAIAERASSCAVLADVGTSDHAPVVMTTA